MLGDAVALGYVNQPAETDAQFVDGWYATRDLVRVDEAGAHHRREGERDET